VCLGTPTGWPAARLLHWADAPGRAQERGANGREDGSARTAAQHQSCCILSCRSWSDEKCWPRYARRCACNGTQGPIEAWIIDDTGSQARKASVGVQHQYCGQLGKEANCQCRLAVDRKPLRSLPVAYRLYLPKEWIKEGRAETRQACRVSSASRQARDRAGADTLGVRAGLPSRGALMDAAYGTDSRLRTGMTALGVSYVVAFSRRFWYGHRHRTEARGRPLNNTGRRDEPI